jgi:hypothetical protein
MMSVFWGERPSAIDAWLEVSRERRERTPAQQADALARARARAGPHTRALNGW